MANSKQHPTPISPDTHHIKPPSPFPALDMFERAGLSFDPDSPPEIADRLGAILECYAAAVLNLFHPGIAPDVKWGTDKNGGIIVASELIKDSMDWDFEVDMFIDQNPDNPLIDTHSGKKYKNVEYHRKKALTHGKKTDNLATSTLLSWFIADIDVNPGNLVVTEIENDQGENIGYHFKRIDTGRAFYFPHINDRFSYAECTAITNDMFTPQGLSDFIKNRWLYTESKIVELTENLQTDPTNPKHRRFLKFHAREDMLSREWGTLDEYLKLGFSKEAFDQKEIDNTIKAICTTRKAALWQVAKVFEQDLLAIRNELAEDQALAYMRDYGPQLLQEYDKPTVEAMAIAYGEQQAGRVLGSENSIFNRLANRQEQLKGLYKEHHPEQPTHPEFTTPKKTGIQSYPPLHPPSCTQASKKRGRENREPTHPKTRKTLFTELVGKERPASAESLVNKTQTDLVYTL